MQRILRAQHVVTSIGRVSTRRAARTITGRPQQAPKPSQLRNGDHVANAPTSNGPAPAPRREEKLNPLQLDPSRRIPWIISSLLAGGIAFYLGGLLVAAVHSAQSVHNPAITSLDAQKDVSARYDETADSFDSEVGISETLMGINRIRKRLARMCKGHVLEVSCGTGRNLGYFDLGKESRVDSLTFVDLSPQMVEVCKKKWDVLLGEERDIVERGRLQGMTLPGKLKRSLVVRFLVGSAVGEMPGPPPVRKAPKQGEAEGTVERKEKYTTILQTMGLCSTPSPHGLLASLVTHLDTSDPDARILLLEHGRSTMSWLNNILDNSAEKHAEIHGCWYNRNIGAIVDEEAEKAGLIVERSKRRHFGTTWIYELKPGPKLLAKSQEEKVEEKGLGWGWKQLLSPWK